MSIPSFFHTPARVDTASEKQKLVFMALTRAWK